MITAKLTIHDLGDGIKQYEVECRYAVTGLTFIPGSVELSEGALINSAAAEHQRRCGRCNVEPVYAQGDPFLRWMAEQAWAKAVERAMRERRN